MAVVVFTTSLHAFGILIYLKGLGQDAAVEGLHVEEVRSLLDVSLETLRDIGRPSLMSQKARRCLLRFLDVFDLMCTYYDDCNYSLIISSLFTELKADLQLLLALDESVSNTRPSNVSGVDVHMAMGGLVEPIDELLTDFDFSQFITDTADEFLSL